MEVITFSRISSVACLKKDKNYYFSAKKDSSTICNQKNINQSKRSQKKVLGKIGPIIVQKIVEVTYICTSHYIIDNAND